MQLYLAAGIAIRVKRNIDYGLRSQIVAASSTPEAESIFRTALYEEYPVSNDWQYTVTITPVDLASCQEALLAR